MSSVRPALADRKSAGLWERLRALLFCPTAPFFEHAPREHLARRLTRAGVSSFVDPDGNLVVGLASAREYVGWIRAQRTSRLPAPLWVAHLDHPGLVLAPDPVASERRLWAARWLGGGPISGLVGHSVECGPTGIRGVVRAVDLARATEPLTQRLADGIAAGITVEITGPLPRELERGRARSFGYLHFGEQAWLESGLIMTKAADDLIGCAVIAELAELAAKRRRQAVRRSPVVAVLTRAEEVGFVGWLAHLQRYYPVRREPTAIGGPLVVSLETSRELPGAEIGQGAVLRLGDRASLFDATALELWRASARACDLRHQRRIMDGGTCEATAALAFGLRTIGLSVPLGGYHNQDWVDAGALAALPPPASPLRSPKPVPERVALRDVENAIELCSVLHDSLHPAARGTPRPLVRDPWRERREELLGSLGRFGASLARPDLL